jgi:hypothetical protein
VKGGQEDLLTALRDRWGEHWKIWLVYCYPGPDVWCAHRWGEEKKVINATSPDELERLLAAAS